jgi:hypothetical protein
MVDPVVTSAAGAAAKLGSAVAASRYRPFGQPRVGGREERRQVYTRFQESVVSYVMQIRDSRISPELLNLDGAQRKSYIDALLAATTEFAQALYELRLVGNPGPIEAAESVRQAVTDSFDAAAARREAMTAREIDLYSRAMRGFTTACRIDLWYQPRWWQVWRGAWWTERWAGLRGRRGRKPAATDAPPVQAIRGAGIQTNEYVGNVVFGVSKAESGTSRAGVKRPRDAVGSGDLAQTVLGPRPGATEDTRDGDGSSE